MVLEGIKKKCIIQNKVIFLASGINEPAILMNQGMECYLKLCSEMMSWSTKIFLRQMRILSTVLLIYHKSEYTQ